MLIALSREKTRCEKTREKYYCRTAGLALGRGHVCGRQNFCCHHLWSTINCIVELARIEIKALYLYPQNYCANKRCLLMILFVYLKCNSLFILQTSTVSHTALGNYEKTQCCLCNFYFLLSTLPCSERRGHGLKWSYLLHRGNSLNFLHYQGTRTDLPVETEWVTRVMAINCFVKCSFSPLVKIHLTWLCKGCHGWGRILMCGSSSVSRARGERLCQ